MNAQHHAQRHPRVTEKRAQQRTRGRRLCDATDTGRELVALAVVIIDPENTTAGVVGKPEPVLSGNGEKG